MPKLVWIQIWSAGFDEPLKAPIFQEPGPPLLLTGASGIHSPQIAEYVMGVAISLLHNLKVEALFAHTEKRWNVVAQKNLMAVMELRGRTMGILGYGHIGRECARLATAFGMNILACSSDGNKKVEEGYVIPGTGDIPGDLPNEWFSSKSPESFKEFLRKTDILVLSLPLAPSTHRIMNAETISYLPAKSVIINVGRGGLVDQDALLSALDQGKIHGAGIDVTDPEPLPDNHPIFTHPNVLFTPHTSGNSERYVERICELANEQVNRVRRGELPFNIYAKDRGY